MGVQNDNEAGDGTPVMSNRVMEIVVALILLALSAIAIFDSVRVGFRWQEGEGPQPGYFPFWVSVILAVSALAILLNALSGSGKALAAAFVSSVGLRRIASIVVPVLIYIAAIGGIKLGPLSIPGLGIYVASALFITGFMTVIGREGIVRAALVGCGVSLALFFMFERWFIVPLPKGPLEALLGFG